MKIVVTMTLDTPHSTSLNAEVVRISVIRALQSFPFLPFRLPSHSLSTGFILCHNPTHGKIPSPIDFIPPFISSLHLHNYLPYFPGFSLDFSN